MTLTHDPHSTSVGDTIFAPGKGIATGGRGRAVVLKIVVRDCRAMRCAVHGLRLRLRVIHRRRATEACGQGPIGQSAIRVSLRDRNATSGRDHSHDHCGV